MSFASAAAFLVDRVDRIRMVGECCVVVCTGLSAEEVLQINMIRRIVMTYIDGREGLFFGGFLILSCLRR